MVLPEWLSVDRRLAPSANTILVRGPDGAVLVDCGSGTRASDARLEAFLAARGLAARELALLVTTHWHADHVGGAARLQRETGVPVAADRAEAALIAAQDPRAFDEAWLGWRVDPYVVDRPLAPGDVIADAGVALHVVPTPGQTPGHLALWEPESRVVLTGDLLQRDDVGWMPAGGPWAPGAADTLIASVERLAALDAVIAVPGHGPVVDDVADAVQRSLARYRRWRDDAEPAAWHAARRVFVTYMMLSVTPVTELHARMEPVGPVRDIAALTGMSSGTVVDRLLADLTGSGALAVRDGVVVPAMPFESH